jgi:adenylate cyclase
MTEERTNRRLAAILAADVVGYSRMMGTDETGTLAALKRHRETVFAPAVVEHGGRVVKLIGDGTLVEFMSVVDAVSCALAIQRAVKAEAQAGSSEIVLRIGINLGDVIIDGDDIYGDGVNVAARLEPLAEPGGVCVASIVNESIGSRIDVSFRDGGEVTVKNIQRPIRVWKWHPDSDLPSERAHAVDSPTSSTKLERPSIAVLPFNNMSGDPEQEYFSDGIAEDIITDLSKVGGLLVIARNSSFAYKGQNPDIRAVGRELGVKSVLEGSIRRAGNRVRITAQLIDAADGGHLWAERYDRDLTDIFEVQDEVTRRIVSTLKVRLTPAEDALLNDGGARDPDAHDCYLRACEFLFGPVKNRERFEEARGFLDRAIALDAGYAKAHAGLGLAFLFDYFNHWSDDPDPLRAAHGAAERAIAADTKEPMGHLVLARVTMYEKNLGFAKGEVTTALALNPNFALAHYTLGCIEMYLGQPLKAMRLIERAMRLDPAFTQQYLHFLGCAYLVAGKYETAAAVLKQRVVMVPDTDLSRAFLSSALGHIGEVGEARQIWAELMAVNPRYDLTDHIGRLPFREADVETIRIGLAKASLPD